MSFLSGMWDKQHTGCSVSALLMQERLSYKRVRFKRVMDLLLGRGGELALTETTRPKWLVPGQLEFFCSTLPSGLPRSQTLFRVHA